MIKFMSTKGETILVGLGISEGNVERLKQGKPIVVKLKELGAKEDIEVMIFYGKTEEDMAETLRPYIGEHTKVHPLKEK